MAVLVVMQVLGLPVMRVAGVEADDVIGTVASRAVKEGFLVAVASPDKASSVSAMMRVPGQSCRQDAWRQLGHANLNICACMQDFFQILQPRLQLLRPPKRDARDGPGVVAGYVAYSYDAFKAEYGIEPHQVTACPPMFTHAMCCSCAALLACSCAAVLKGGLTRCSGLMCWR